MKWQVWSFALVPSVLLAPLVIAGSTEAQGLKRVSNGTPPAADTNARQESSTFDESAWKTRLTAGDLDARERAYDELARVVREDETARRAVEGWSRDANAPELAWTSRLLLRTERAADANGPRAGFGRMRSGSGFGGGPGVDDLRARFDELERGFGGLDSMFEDMQRDLDRAFGSGPGVSPGQGFSPGQSPSPGQSFAPGQNGSNRPGATATPPGAGLHRQAQSYSMRMGPDGVTVEVQENVDGKQETKTYTAKTLDELYDAHPELRDRMGLRMRTGPFSNRGGLRVAPGNVSPFDDDSDAWWGRGGQLVPAPQADGRVPTDRLGVVVDESAKIDRATTKLDEGVGLVVRSVQDDTIASKIGLEPGDVIADVNGRAIHGVDDVRAVLSSRKIDEDVTVTVYDAHGKRRTLTWRANAAATEKERSF